MMLDETQRREIGRQATQFCRNCPAIEERAWGENVMRICHNPQCRLWAFLRLLGLRPGMDFSNPATEEGLARAHGHETRRFRGLLPFPASDHDWEADARFHGLMPGAKPVGERSTGRLEDTRPTD